MTDRAKLHGHIVIAWNKDVGLVVSRLESYDGNEILVPDNREYGSTPLGKKQLWRILGRVLWWIGLAD